jgi:hypothetical protein
MDDKTVRARKSLIAIVGFGCLALHICLLVTSLARRATVYSAVNAESTDASSSVRTIENTSWTTNNHYFPYGPLYYRLAHTLLLLDPVFQVAPATDLESRDKSMHLALMEVSLFATVGIAYLLAALSAPIWFHGWVTSLLLFLMIGTSNIWMAFTIDNHPDILLTLFVALGTCVLVWGADELSVRRRTVFLAVAGGLFGFALSAKPSAIVFIGAAFLGVFTNSLWLMRSRQAIWDAAAFVFAVVLSYILIGLPQSLDYETLYEFLSMLTKKSTGSFEWKSWVDLWFNVSIFPLIALAAAFIAFYRGTESQLQFPTWRAFFSYSVIPLVGLVSLFILDNQPNRTHYILPVFASGLICLMVPIRIGGKVLSGRFNTLQWRLLVGALCLAVSCCVVVCKGTYVENSAQLVYSRFGFIKEAEVVHNQIAPLLSQKKKIIFDFYVPYDDRKYSSFIPTRHFNKQLIGDADSAEYFVSSKWYYERFLRDEPKGWEKVFLTTDDFRASRELYMSLNAPHDFFLDGKSRRWNLRFRSPLGWEIWQRQIGPSSSR